MTERDSVPTLLEQLRSAPVGVATPEETAAERQIVLPWLEEQIDQMPLRRQRHRVTQRRRRALAAGVAVFGAAAAAALLVHLGPAAPEGSGAGGDPSGAEGYATLVSGRLLHQGVDILPGSRLGDTSVVRSSPTERAVLEGSSGYTVELRPGSELDLGGTRGEPARQELRLLRGEVALSVAPRREGSTLSVVTEDARVTVRGTRFSVALVEGPDGPQSCVRVTEGAVEVRRRGSPGELLTPGGASGCPTNGETSLGEGGTEATRSSTDPAPRRAAGARASTERAPSAHQRPGADLSRSPGSSTLAEEVQLLGAALAAEQQGDLPRARRHLETLLGTYPESTLRREARAALDRIVAKERRPDSAQDSK